MHRRAPGPRAARSRRALRRGARPPRGVPARRRAPRAAPEGRSVRAPLPARRGRARARALAGAGGRRGCGGPVSPPPDRPGATGDVRLAARRGASAGERPRSSTISGARFGAAAGRPLARSRRSRGRPAAPIGARRRRRRPGRRREPAPARSTSGYRGFFELRRRRSSPTGDRQCARLRGGARAGRGAGRARPRQDGVLQQRQPRVPHAADAHARAASRTCCRRQEPLPAAARARSSWSHRNGLRLLKLVNTLLDFSRIEAGRVQASLRADRPRARSPRELASVFRSAMERAGLRARSSTARRCPEPVYVDRDMWEKIVLNLLSNAFKFTFEGEIARPRCDGRRRSRASWACATPDGIPAEELPHLFERFHRVEGARGRTHEGTGHRPRAGAGARQAARRHRRRSRARPAGARLHGERSGRERVTCLPSGSDRCERPRPPRPEPLAFVEEATALAPGGARPRRSEKTPFGVGAGPVPGRGVCLRPRSSSPTTTPTCGATSTRLLRRTREGRRRSRTARRRWRRSRRKPPDLVLSDVMMPGLDGFGLLRALRADERTRALPIMLALGPRR